MRKTSDTHHDEDPDIKIGEKCAVFGVYGKGLEASRLAFFGLYALQHRGQEASGISASDGNIIRTHKGPGLVNHVYDEQILSELLGHIAVGHNRYSTSGGGGHHHNQPCISSDNILALAHNGNLPSTKKLEKFLKLKGIEINEYNDSEMMFQAIQYFLNTGSTIEESMAKSFPLFTGAFNLIVMTKDKLVAMRDECGIRPLSIGKLNGGYVISSETCALDTVNAEFVRDVKPGEMIVVDEEGLHSFQLVEGKQKLDIFEFVYFARPDSMLLGKKVYMVRRNFGKILAQEHPIKADVVIPVPESAIPQAIGYSEELGVPFEYGLIKNRYIGRTFILPDQKLRNNSVKMKLNPINEVIKGRSVAIVDDSLVRGTTSKKMIQMIRDAGAKEVHLLISSPPVKYPDFYGIDTPRQEDLIGSQKTIEEIREFIGADSLSFLSYEGLIKGTGLNEDMFSTSCFTGVYPIDIEERAKEIQAVI